MLVETIAESSLDPLNVAGTDRPTISPDASTGSPLSVARNCPIPSKASRPKPMGSMFMWQDGQIPVLVRFVICSRDVLPGAPAGTFGSTLGGGGGTSLQKMPSRIKCPRCVGEEAVVRAWPKRTALLY